MPLRSSKESELLETLNLDLFQLQNEHPGQLGTSGNSHHEQLG